MALETAAVGAICAFWQNLLFMIFVHIYIGIVPSLDLHEGQCGIYMLILFSATALLILFRKSSMAVIPAAINAILCILKVIDLGYIKTIVERKFQSVHAYYMYYVGNIFFWLVVVLSVVEAAVIVIVPMIRTKRKK